MKVTERDLIIALEKASLSNVDGVTGFTAREMAEITGVTHYKANRSLNYLIKTLGIMEFAGKRPALTRNNVHYPVPVYKFLDGLDISSVLELLESNDVNGIQELVKQARNDND